VLNVAQFMNEAGRRAITGLAIEPIREAQKPRYGSRAAGTLVGVVAKPI
jgi:hypothetical protein